MPKPSGDSGSDPGTWCTIESDPGVFTELIKEFVASYVVPKDTFDSGCKGVQVEELYSLDEEFFYQMQPIHGLIFLFKWLPGDKPEGSVVRDAHLQEIFFAQQVIQNACASQAIINCLMNCESSDVNLGPVLTDFKNFTTGFDPATKGLSLSNQEVIRKAHNSFSRQQVFEIDIKSKEKEDSFHFVTYIPIKGRVYELDGLQSGPIDLGKIPDGQDWMNVVKPIIEARMLKYSAGEIHFNLVAIISDRKQIYEKKMAELVSLPSNEETLHEIEQLKEMIMSEESKLEQYKKENLRRRHNYIPFIIELIKILAKEGRLVPLVKEAKENAEQKAKAKKNNKSEGTAVKTES